MKKQAFIDSISPGAVATMKKYGVLASVTIAQAILESGWGNSGLTLNANNLFGIKATGNEPYVEMKTIEYINGQINTIYAKFRKYSSLAESIADHGKFLVVNSRYKNLLWLKDYKKVCSLIQQDGYATDPNYSNLLISIIEENNLQKYDDYGEILVPGSTTSVSLWELQKYFNDYISAGLIQDGIYGPKTQAAANNIIIKIGSKGNIVKWIQNKLIVLGYAMMNYGADGNFGEETKNTVIRFQINKGLVPDGIIGSNTWKALMTS